MEDVLGRPDLLVDESVAGMLSTPSVVAQEIVVGTLQVAGHDLWQWGKGCGTR